MEEAREYTLKAALAVINASCPCSYKYSFIVFVLAVDAE